MKWYNKSDFAHKPFSKFAAYSPQKDMQGKSLSAHNYTEIGKIGGEIYEKDSYF